MNMPKRIVLYPFLFTLYVVLNPLVNNLGEILLSQALRPLIALLLATALIMLILRLIFRDWHYAGYLTFLLLAFFFLYSHISRMLQDRFSLNVDAIRPALLAGWGGLFLALGVKRIWLRFGGARVTRALNIYLGLLLFVGVLSGAPTLSKSIAQPSERDGPPRSLDGAVQLDCTNTPDIYFIILDAYGRADVLESMYGVDNSAFIARLESKGFYVASQSHPNYIQSIFSIPSGLNFSYLESEPAGVDAAEYFTSLIANNQLMQTLKQCGYQTIAFETGFSFSDRPQVNLYLSGGSPLNNFENLLLADSPLDWLPQVLFQRPPAYSYEGHRERVLFTFDELATIPGRPGPKMVFAHIISPHPPFVFDARGNAVQPPRSYSIGDGDDYRGGWEEYRQGYAGQVQFVNRMLEKTVDVILSKSSTPPVILIQGDHGPGGFLDWDSPEQSCLWERASIFNAYYLPGAEANVLSADISPVNSFRIVLKIYFDANMELLPDRTYFTSHRLTRQIIDITGQRDSTLNCP
jgi:hypothetical protein